MTFTMNDDNSMAEFFNLGSDAPANEQLARSLLSEADVIANQNATKQQQLAAEQQRERRNAKDMANYRAEMAKHRRDASIVAEDANIRSQTRSMFQKQMNDEVVAIVSPPTSPTNGKSTNDNGSDDGGATGGTHTNSNILIATANEGRGDVEDQDDGGIIMPLVTPTNNANANANNNHFHQHPEQYIAQRRQELGKCKASIQASEEQINANLLKARTADAQEAELRDRIAADDLAGKKAEHDRQVEVHRRELDATKRREHSLAEAARNCRTRYGENGTAMAERNKELMTLKKENHDVELQLAQSLAALEEEIAKGTTSEIATIQARLAAQSGQLDHMRRQHDDVKQLRAKGQITAEDTTKTIAEKRDAENTIAVKERERSEAATKREAAQTKADDITKAEEELRQLEIAADEEDAAKRQAVCDEKDQLLKDKQAATAALANLQKGSSQDDKTEEVLAETVKERKDVEMKTDEQRRIIQEIEIGFVNIKDESAKDDETTTKQISTFDKMKAATEENIEGQKENNKSKEDKHRSQVKKAVEKIRERLGEKRASFDLLLNVLRGGSNLIDDKNAKVEAIQAKPIPSFDEEDDQSTEVVLSTEAVNPPSPSQQSVRHDMSGTGGGNRRRRMSGTGGGYGTSRRRRST